MGKFLKMRVSEIRVKQIRVNQGLGVFLPMQKDIPINIFFLLDKPSNSMLMLFCEIQINMSFTKL